MRSWQTPSMGSGNVAPFDSQLIVTLQDLAKGLDNKTQTDVILLDYEKAFDKVSHPHPKYKLANCECACSDSAVAPGTVTSSKFSSSSFSSNFQLITSSVFCFLWMWSRWLLFVLHQLWCFTHVCACSLAWLAHHRSQPCFSDFMRIGNVFYRWPEMAKCLFYRICYPHLAKSYIW